MRQETDNDSITELRNTAPALAASLERLLRGAHERTAAVREFMASAPQSEPCPAHPARLLPIDQDATARATLEAGGVLTAGYAPCPACAELRRQLDEEERLLGQGVPPILAHATFENWCADGERAEAHLAKVQEFAGVRRGFLLLLGPAGTGKSHLAIATLRQCGLGLYIKQSTLLRWLRRTYRDETTADPVSVTQAAKLLVLDEVGLSGGGRDELPLLHEILDHRHCHQKPTVLTGNLEWPEMKQVIGDRLADRLRESAFAILTFSGKSRRPDFRERYFQRPARETGLDLPRPPWERTGPPLNAI